MMTYGSRAVHGRKMAQSYVQVGLETEVMSASPEKLISLLFQGARASIAKAKLYMEMGNIPERGKAISKAIDIVQQGLRASVDESVGEVAKNLILTYDLVSHHLLLANVHSSPNNLDIADKMLQEVSEAWRIATEQAN